MENDHDKKRDRGLNKAKKSKTKAPDVRDQTLTLNGETVNQIYAPVFVVALLTRVRNA